MTIKNANTTTAFKSNVPANLTRYPCLGIASLLKTAMTNPEG